MTVLLCLLMGTAVAQQGPRDNEDQLQETLQYLSGHFGPIRIGPERCSLKAGSETLSVPFVVDRPEIIQDLPGGRTPRPWKNLRSELVWYVQSDTIRRQCENQGSTRICYDEPVEFWVRRGSIPYTPWPAFADVRILDLLVFGACDFAAAPAEALTRILLRMPKRERLHVLAILYGQLWFDMEHAQRQDIALSTKALIACGRGRQRSCTEIADSVSGGD